MFLFGQIMRFFQTLISHAHRSWLQETELCMFPMAFARIFNFFILLCFYRTRTEQLAVLLSVSSKKICCCDMKSLRIETGILPRPSCNSFSMYTFLRFSSYLQMFPVKLTHFVAMLLTRSRLATHCNVAQNFRAYWIVYYSLLVYVLVYRLCSFSCFSS